MIRNIKSFALGFLTASAFLFLPVLASKITAPNMVERQLARFVSSFKCYNVDVQDINLWDSKVLVKARDLNISFVMTAKDSATYEICPVGTGVKNLQALEKKK